MDFQFGFHGLVLQPTSLCNLNCEYCYLSERDKRQEMSVEITERVAKDLEEFPNKNILVMWHGGEPLACGLEHFSMLINPFVKLERQGTVTHSIQTNATLIDSRWCQFFQEHDINVGISLDGPIWANKKRVDWAGNESYERTLRGIRFLKEAKIKFSVIAVVNFELLDKAKEMYEFFCELGCDSLGINIEERECANQSRLICDDERVAKFWHELFIAWQEHPRIRVREFLRTLRRMHKLNEASWAKPKVINENIFPSVAHNGDVVFLSPELLGGKSPEYNNFVVGNILSSSLQDIIDRGQNAGYVQDYLVGVTKCETECTYFLMCQGGQASNKFYEHDTTNATETVFCRNHKKRLIDGILGVLQ